MKPTLRDVNSKPGLHTSEPYPKIHTGAVSFGSAPSASPGGGEAEEEEERSGVDDDSGSGLPGHSSGRCGSRFMSVAASVVTVAGVSELVGRHAPPPRFKGPPGPPRPRPPLNGRGGGAARAG